ncbi:MAG TPA: HNH endonuclease signature motif containing protein [Burkholderiales bacterium]|nr:HNH endonuclease signature motif containing protein [Burkholderiales bacterium]
MLHERGHIERRQHMPVEQTEDHRAIFLDLVDYLLPELTAYEAAMYLVMLRDTILGNGDRSLRTGKRTLSAKFAKGARGERTNYAHITKVLKGLEDKGCLKIGDTTREGTSYTVVPPREVPIVIEQLAVRISAPTDSDYFSSPEKRQEIFERDKWTCQYCGEKIAPDNSTLDHFVPRSKGGDNSKENLKVACLMCNSVKSGRSYEEAAPRLIDSIRERKMRLNDTDS